MHPALGFTIVVACGYVVAMVIERSLPTILNAMAWGLAWSMLAAWRIDWFLRLLAEGGWLFHGKGYQVNNQRLRVWEAWSVSEVLAFVPHDEIAEFLEREGDE